MNKGAAQRQLLFHSTGKFSCTPVAERLDVDIDVADEIVILHDRSAKQSGKEIQVFGNRKILIEGKASRHIANPLADLTILMNNVEAIHGGRSAVRQKKGGEDSEDARLAGAIGSYKSKYLPRAYREGNIAHSLKRSLVVSLGDVM